MYRFTNGVVVYDEETKNKYIKAGMILVKEPKPEVKEEKEIVKSDLYSEPKRREFKETNKRDRKFVKGFR